jgi:hypothetical protein
VDEQLLGRDSSRKIEALFEGTRLQLISDDEKLIIFSDIRNKAVEDYYYKDILEAKIKDNKFISFKYGPSKIKLELLSEADRNEAIKILEQGTKKKIINVETPKISKKAILVFFLSIFLPITLVAFISEPGTFDSIEPEKKASEQKTSSDLSKPCIKNLADYDFSEYLRARSFSTAGYVAGEGLRSEYTKTLLYPQCDYRVKVSELSEAEIYEVFSRVHCVDAPEFISLAADFQSKILEITLKDRYGPNVQSWLTAGLHKSNNQMKLEEVYLDMNMEHDDSGDYSNVFIKTEL